MHYALHILIGCIVFNSILREGDGDKDAIEKRRGSLSKTTLKGEPYALKSFAENVASILTPALLNELQQSNRLNRSTLILAVRPSKKYDKQGDELGRRVSASTSSGTTIDKATSSATTIQRVRQALAPDRYEKLSQSRQQSDYQEPRRFNEDLYDLYSRDIRPNGHGNLENDDDDLTAYRRPQLPFYEHEAPQLRPSSNQKSTDLPESNLSLESILNVDRRLESHPSSSNFDSTDDSLSTTRLIPENRRRTADLGHHLLPVDSPHYFGPIGFGSHFPYYPAPFGHKHYGHRGYGYEDGGDPRRPDDLEQGDDDKEQSSESNDGSSSNDQRPRYRPGGFYDGYGYHPYDFVPADYYNKHHDDNHTDYYHRHHYHDRYHEPFYPKFHDLFYPKYHGYRNFYFPGPFGYHPVGYKPRGSSPGTKNGGGEATDGSGGGDGDDGKEVEALSASETDGNFRGVVSSRPEDKIFSPSSSY